MKATILGREVNIAYVRLLLPMPLYETTLPAYFPLRESELWRAVVDIDTGQIRDWPKGEKADLHLNVGTGGTYTLLSPDFHWLGCVSDKLPPHKLIPGTGDYVDLHIDENGVITNWPKNPDVSEFSKSLGRINFEKFYVDYFYADQWNNVRPIYKEWWETAALAVATAVREYDALLDKRL